MKRLAILNIPHQLENSLSFSQTQTTSSNAVPKSDLGDMGETMQQRFSQETLLSTASFDHSRTAIIQAEHCELTDPTTHEVDTFGVESNT
jgi:hypothetical protein